MRRIALLAAALALVAGPAAACLVCIALPERTLADRVIEAEAVVLARPDPARPFAFAPVAALKGDAARPAIPGLVDSATRRRLAADPEAAVLFARDADGWTRLADATPELRADVETILAAAPAWDAEADHAARFAFFAERHDHPDAGVRALALAEISRAPYALIRTMPPRLGRAEVVRLMRDPRMAEWAPIHILFLGLSDDPEDHAFVRRAFDAASRTGGAHLAAWATALAEIDGPPAIDRLRALYFEESGRSPEDLRAVVTAFATLADGGDPTLRPASTPRSATSPRVRPRWRARPRSSSHRPRTGPRPGPSPTCSRPAPSPTRPPSSPSPSISRPRARHSARCRTGASNDPGPPPACGAGCCTTCRRRRR
jgi:hypothetical protein